MTVRNSLGRLASAAPVVLVATLVGAGTGALFAGTPPVAIISGLVAVCSLWLMHKAVRVFNFRMLTIPGLCYLYYVGIVFVPSFFVFADHPGPYRDSYMFGVESVMLTMPLGILLAKSILRFDPTETAAFFRSPLQEASSDPGPEVFILFLGFAWIITFLYVREVRTIPLFYLITHPGQPEVLSRMREESMKLLDSPLRYTYMVLDSFLYPLLIVFGFARYLYTKRLLWAALFLASLIPGLLYAGATIAKGSVAALCVMLCLCFYLYRHGRVGTIFVVVVVVMALAFPLFVVTQEYAYDRNSGFIPSLQALGHRMFYLPADILYYFFEVFPHVVPYQYGKTIDKIAMLTGDHVFDAANAVGRYIYPFTQYSINANAPFVGNLNADFGMPGILVGGFLAGLIVEIIQIYVVRRGKTAFNLAIYAILLWKFTLISETALPIALLSQGPILLLVTAWMMRTLHSMTLVRRPRDLSNRTWQSRGQPDIWANR